MWERWHAEIDRALRDAELARDVWSDREFRAEMRNDPSEALRRFRLVAEAPRERVARRRRGWWERAVGWMAREGSSPTANVTAAALGRRPR